MKLKDQVAIVTLRLAPVSARRSLGDWQRKVHRLLLVMRMPSGRSLWRRN